MKQAIHFYLILHNLHWLPINYHIEYKVATFAFKHDLQAALPAYFMQSVTTSITTSAVFISTPFFSSLLSEQKQQDVCINQAASSVWNSLPVEIRISKTAI